MRRCPQSRKALARYRVRCGPVPSNSKFEGLQRTRANRRKTDAGPYGSPQPVDDFALQQAIRPSRIDRGAKRLVHRARHDDERVFGKTHRQRVDAGQAKSSRAEDVGGRPDIGHGKLDRRLLHISSSQNLHRSGDI